MIEQSRHQLSVTCECALCVERHWEAVTAEYTLPTKEQCISAMQKAGWVFDNDKHYAPGHLEKYGRHVSELEKSNDK
jgi:hypothetical protein